MGRRLAKSTYSTFVMAVIMVFIKWLASEGWRKSGWRAATVAGSAGLKAGEAGSGVATLWCCLPPSDGFLAGTWCRRTGDR